MNTESLEKMQFLFEIFLNDPDQLGKKARHRQSQDSLHRIIADYIAGMTDTFALKEYKRYHG